MVADETIALGAISAVVAYLAHDLLHSGLWEDVPVVSGEIMSVGVAMAALALVGVYINAMVREGDL